MIRPTRRDALSLLPAALAALAASRAAAMVTTAAEFTFPALEGGELRLADHAGRVLLVVNTASFCAFTDQYRGLQRLADRHGGEGLTVIGVPSDDFNQEYGSATEVKEFCEVSYDITFPMTDITRVTGPDAHPFYRWAAEAGGRAYVPRWNFHKILIGRDGLPAAAFATGTAPEAPALTAAIDAALAA